MMTTDPTPMAIPAINAELSLDAVFASSASGRQNRSISV